MRVKPISTGGRSGGLGCLVVFSAFFFLPGAAIFVAFFILPVWQWGNAQSWEAAQCTITHSELGVHSGSDSTTYSIDITFRYTYQKQTFTSDRYNFFTVSSSGKKSKRTVIAQYPVGSKQTCYVNPDKPYEAVLSLGFSYAYIIGLFGLPFMAVGIGLPIGMVYARRKAAIAETSMSMGGNRATASVLPGGGAASPGSITLHAKNTRGAGVIIGAVMVIVGGIFVFIFHGKAMSGDIGAMLGTAIPGLIGAAGLVTIVYSIPLLFNPRPELTLSPGAVPLGGTATLAWRVRGGSKRIESFRVFLCGREEVRYRQGTNTRTERDIFSWTPLAEARNLAEIQSGAVSFTVPEFSMHSFEAENNRVRWYILVHGDIARWPDVRGEFPITVLPLGQ